MGRSSLEWLCFFIAVVERSASRLHSCAFRTRRMSFFDLCSLIEELLLHASHARLAGTASSVPLVAGAELSARTCKSQRVRTSGEILALAKSRCRQVRHGAWKSGEA